MRRRGFYFLLSTCVALIVAGIVGVVVFGRGPAPSPPRKPIFAGLADRLGELAWMRVSRGAAKVDFANVAGRWVVVEKDNYPADPARVRRLLRGLAELTLVEPDAPDTGSPGTIGPDGAATGAPTQIVLRGRAGNTVAEAGIATVPVAAAGAGADQVYVRTPGAEHASLARGSVEVPSDLLGWLDRGIVDLSTARVAAVSLTAADGAMLTIERNRPDAAFAIAQPPEGARATTEAGLSDLAGALEALVFEDVRPLASIELPVNEIARAEFATFDGLTIGLRLFPHDGADWVAVAASGTGAAAAESSGINERVARWVYEIPAARAKLLRTRLADLTEPARGL